MNPPTALTAEMFGDFFRALWGKDKDPFPWQQDFAQRVCAGQTPDYVTVPTGSGKTACLDAAVFALAVQAARPVAERSAGRRIFFIVNRRIIVDEAYERAKTLAAKLSAALKEAAPDNIVAQVAGNLKHLAGEDADTPLACAQLRGGIYRDRAWAKSILQPMILCSTVDQAGSRLLFRGYGVSDEARPIHAALVAQDSLLLIDEAHISQPFLQTLAWVKRYRLHQPSGAETVTLPFSIVRMTATPPKDETATMLELTDQDREHPVLKRRLTASKPVRLVLADKAKGKKAIEELVKVLEAEASKLITEQPQLRSIAIMVNRVKTARDLADALTKKYAAVATAKKAVATPTARVTLLIGRMRPLDRDQVTKDLQVVLKTGVAHQDGTPLQIIVSTQCLEVGADLDFDALISECASLDALRQRFGRLNRDGRPISAHGVIVLPEEQNKEEHKLDDSTLDMTKLADPIYGNAIPRTWRWLQSLVADNAVDFGLNAMTSAVNSARQTDEAAFDKLLMPRANAPVLLPDYLDCWAQTNPSPAADPDVSLFLHGPQRDMAEVQVCWRADLPADDEKLDRAELATTWAETLALCPPTTLECLPVPLHLMRQWLKGEASDDTSGDAPAVTVQEENDNRKREKPLPRTALIWKGEDSAFAQSITALHPGQTLVLRAQEGGWETLGHVPQSNEGDPTSFDRGDEGQAKLKRKAIVRLHENVFWPFGDADSPAGQLKKWINDTEFDWRSPQAKTALLELAKASSDNPFFQQRLRQLLHCDCKPCLRAKLSADENEQEQQLIHCKRGRYDAEAYPDGSGIVFTARSLLLPSSDNEGDSSDDGPNDPLLEQSKKQTLTAHTAQVTGLAVRYAEALGLSKYQDTIQPAAELHDIGKADPRFQAMLLQSTVSAVLAQPVLWAKSESIPSSITAREKARERATLPKGFRHEMLSHQLAALPDARSLLPTEALRYALVLHLIASHHGHARPFAPVVTDDEPREIQFTQGSITLSLSSQERSGNPAHAIDSGLAERFWQLTRHHGWWGLALLEAILRLADQTASANPTHE